MALVFMDGFDTYNSGSQADAFRRKWFATSDMWVSANNSYYGTNTMRVWANNGITTGNIGPGGNRLLVGFWYYSDTVGHNSTFIRTYSATNSTLAGITEVLNGKLTVYQYRNNGTTSYPGGSVVATSNTMIADNRWHWIDIDILYASSGGGHVKVWVDGNQDLNLTGITTVNGTSGTPSIDNLEFHNSTYTNYYIDDFVWYSASGGAPDASSFPLLPQRITTLRPDSDVTQGFTRSAGSTNYTLVNETVPDTDTTYVESDVSTTRDLYGLGNLSITPTAITAVALNTMVRNNGSGAISMKHVLKSGTTTAVSSSLLTPLNYATKQTFYVVDPNTSSAWTKAAVDSLQAGFEVA